MIVHIPATKETPEVVVDPSKMSFRLSGESYPENAMAFYAPVRNQLEALLSRPAANDGIEAHFNLRYFNSSSKLIRGLIGMLHRRAAEGARIVAHWYHDPDDDMMAEFGADLKDEFDALDFRLIEAESA
jgi:UDP-glucose 4-epimerase